MPLPCLTGTPPKTFTYPPPFGTQPGGFRLPVQPRLRKKYFEGNGFLRELRTILDEETAAKLHGTD